MKAILQFVYKRIPKKIADYFIFIYKNKYIPDFKNPKTFNEKINQRKETFANALFVSCSDKIQAKEYVSEKIGSKYIIDNVYIGDLISTTELQLLLKEYGDLYLKANHNSGPVFLLTSKSTESEIDSAVINIMRQLSVDYGSKSLEKWYSKITPKVLVEKRIHAPDCNDDINDYKFHAFKQKNGKHKIVLHVDFERSSNHTRSFFDESLNYLPFTLEYPSIYQSITKPDNYTEMLDIVNILAEPFSYVRVDLYNVAGKIYFGEMTFAHGSGLEEFSSKCYDEWLGKLWVNDPSY